MLIISCFYFNSKGENDIPSAKFLLKVNVMGEGENTQMDYCPSTIHPKCNQWNLVSKLKCKMDGCLVVSLVIISVIYSSDFQRHQLKKESLPKAI